MGWMDREDNWRGKEVRERLRETDRQTVIWSQLCFGQKKGHYDINVLKDQVWDHKGQRAGLKREPKRGRPTKIRQTPKFPESKGD